MGELKLIVMAIFEWNFKFVKGGYPLYKQPLIRFIYRPHWPLPKNIELSNWGYDGDQFVKNEVTLIHKFISAN